MTIVQVSFNRNEPVGEQIFTTTGTNTFTVPADVYTISAVCVGGGGGGGDGASLTPTPGGGGGALAWVKNLPVIPGEKLTIVVGAGGVGGSNIGAAGTTTISRGATLLVSAGGGTNGQLGAPLDGGTFTFGSTVIGLQTGGGNGGRGGPDRAAVDPGAPPGASGGGGGAGGYLGSGGDGGGGLADAVGQVPGGQFNPGGGGGGGGQAATSNQNTGGGGGGGVGITFFGPIGLGGTAGNASFGQGGSGGNNGVAGGGNAGAGGLYGGGSGGTSGNAAVANGAPGAVRIIWGPDYTYPDRLINPYSNIVEGGLVLNLSPRNGYSYSGIGTDWYDLSPSKNDGTIFNSPIYSNSGPTYFTFDSTLSQYVSFKSSSSLQFLNRSPYTLEAWVYPTSNPGAGNYTGIFDREDSSVGSRDGYNILFLGSATTDTFFYTERFTTGTQTSAGGQLLNQSVSVNNWQHIVATYDGTTITLYRNGSISGNPGTSTGNITNTSKTLTVGVRGGQYFTGRIANTRIYNMALSDDEVFKNFNVMRGRFGI